MKLIINNKSSKPDPVALNAVKYVLECGRVSEKGKSYCLAVTMPKLNLVVYTKNNKASDTFTVEDFGKD